MVNYVLGIASGLCLFRILDIIKIYRIRKHCKRYVCKVSTPEELEKALKEIVKDMEEKKNGSC